MANNLYGEILDTFHVKNVQYEFLLYKKGVTEIYLGNYEEGNAILTSLIGHKLIERSEDRLSMYLNKSRLNAICSVVYRL